MKRWQKIRRLKNTAYKRDTIGILGSNCLKFAMKSFCGKPTSFKPNGSEAELSLGNCFAKFKLSALSSNPQFQELESFPNLDSQLQIDSLQNGNLTTWSIFMSFQTVYVLFTLCLLFVFNLLTLFLQFVYTLFTFCF